MFIGFILVLYRLLRFDVGFYKLLTGFYRLLISFYRFLSIFVESQGAILRPQDGKGKEDEKYTGPT